MIFIKSASHSKIQQESGEEVLQAERGRNLATLLRWWENVTQCTTSQSRQVVIFVAIIRSVSKPLQ